jgi:hypothetical protein
LNLHTHRLREPRLQRGAIPFRSSYRLNNLLPLLQRFCEPTASACCMQCWRRRSDSNGWCLFKGHSALAVRCLRPLGHVSLKSLVGMERFELSRATALVSKTSVSPISTTSPLKSKPCWHQWWAPRDSNPEDDTAFEAAASACSARSPQSKSPSISRGAWR